jgi:hypothetical protein
MPAFARDPALSPGPKRKIGDGPELTWRPQSGVLADYVAYVEPTTDAPSVYHVFAGLVAIATIVGSAVYLPFGGERIYPNLWALILGPSSFYRKSTALAKAKRLIARLEAPDDDGSAPARSRLLPNEFSREALLKHLSDNPQGLLSFSEFSGFLAMCSRDYMSGTRELLADLYDSPNSYTRLLGTATYTVRNPCLSILAASQTDWLLEKVREGDLRGGFLARFAFVPAFSKPRFLAVPPAPDNAIGVRLLHGASALRKIRGEAGLQKIPEMRFSSWLERHERELDGAEHVGELSPFWSRLSIITLKLAMLLQLADDRSLVIGPEAMESALALTEFLKASLRTLFREQFVFSKEMKARQRVLAFITRRPGLTSRDILRNSGLLQRDLMPVIATLLAEQTVQCDKGKYFPAEVSDLSVPVGTTSTDASMPTFSSVS